MEPPSKVDGTPALKAVAGWTDRPSRIGVFSGQVYCPSISDDQNKKTDEEQVQVYVR